MGMVRNCMKWRTAVSRNPYSKLKPQFRWSEIIPQAPVALSASGSELKEQQKALFKEDAARRGSPVSGAEGKGTKRQVQFRNWSDQDVSHELARASEQLDQITYTLQEGKLTFGEVLARPWRGLSMFAGVLLTGFGGTWITQGSCYTCGNPDDVARCSWCQCGICEWHGVLLARASQASASGPLPGAFMACCSNSIGCEERQRRILEFWRQQTGEELK